MRLHLVDTLLHRARLFGGGGHASGHGVAYPWPDRSPAMDIDDAELADARAALGG